MHSRLQQRISAVEYASNPEVLVTNWHVISFESAFPQLFTLKHVRLHLLRKKIDSHLYEVDKTILVKICNSVFTLYLKNYLEFLNSVCFIKKNSQKPSRKHIKTYVFMLFGGCGQYFPRKITIFLQNFAKSSTIEEQLKLLKRFLYYCQIGFFLGFPTTYPHICWV